MIYIKYPLYVLTILLFFFTNANGQQLWSGELVPTWGKKNWEGTQDLHAATQLSATGDSITVSIRIKDDHVKFKKDPIHSDHIEIWLALPSNKYTDNPRNFYHAKELDLTYWVKPKYKGNILNQALAENPDDSPNRPYNVTDKKSLNWWFGLRHFGYLPGEGKLISYDDKRSPFQDNVELNESIKAKTEIVNENEYVVTLDIPLEGFGFIPKDGLKAFRVLVDVIDVDNTKQETLLSSSANRKWGKVKTFNTVSLDSPLKPNWSKLFTGKDNKGYLLQKLPEYAIKHSFVWNAAFVGTKPGLKGNDLDSENMGEWLKPYEANIVKNKIGYSSRELGEHLIEQIQGHVYIDQQYAYESKTPLKDYFLLPDNSIAYLYSSGTWLLGRFSRGPCSGAGRDFQMLGVFSKDKRHQSYKLSETEGCHGNVELYSLKTDGSSANTYISNLSDDIGVKHNKDKHVFAYTGYEHDYSLDYSQAGQGIITVSQKKALRIDSYINNAINDSKNAIELEGKLKKVATLFDEEEVHEFRKGYVSCNEREDMESWIVVSKYASYRPCITHSPLFAEPYSQAKDKQQFIQDFVTNLFTSPDRGQRLGAIIKLATDVVDNDTLTESYPKLKGFGVDLLDYAITLNKDKVDTGTANDSDLWYFVTRDIPGRLKYATTFFNEKELKIFNQKVINYLTLNKKFSDIAYIITHSSIPLDLYNELHSKFYFEEKLREAIEAKAENTPDLNLNMSITAIFMRRDMTPDKMKKYIESGIDVKGLRINGGNLLHYYAGVDYLDQVFTYLVDQKLFDVTEKNEEGKSAFEIALTFKTQGYQGVNESTINKAQALIKAGAVKDDETYSYLIHLTLKRSDTQYGIRQLEIFNQLTALPNVKLVGDHADKALEFAIHAYHPEIFLALIKKGANVDYKPGSLTFLMNAAAHADTKTVKSLIEAGATTSITNDQGYNVCDYIGESARQNNTADTLNKFLKCTGQSNRNENILGTPDLDWSDKDITVVGVNSSDSYYTYGPFQIFDFTTKTFLPLNEDTTAYGYLDLSPNNTTLLYTGFNKRQIASINLADKSITTIDGYRRLPKWLTDTSILYISAKNQPCILYVDGTSRCDLKRPEGFNFFETASDGRLLGVIDDSIGLFSVIDQSFRKLTEREENFWIRSPVRMSPDNTKIAIAYKNSGYRSSVPARKVTIFDKNTGKSTVLKVKGDPIEDQIKVHWSNDSKHLLVVHERSTKVRYAKLYNVETGVYEEIER